MTPSKSAVPGLSQTVGTFALRELLFWARPAKLPKQTLNAAQAGRQHHLCLPNPYGLGKFRVWLILTNITATEQCPGQGLGLSVIQRDSKDLSWKLPGIPFPRSALSTIVARPTYGY